MLKKSKEDIITPYKNGSPHDSQLVIFLRNEIKIPAFERHARIVLDIAKTQCSPGTVQMRLGHLHICLNLYTHQTKIIFFPMCPDQPAKQVVPLVHDPSTRSDPINEKGFYHTITTID